MRTKLQAMWKILRGQPVCYRMKFIGSFTCPASLRNALIAECVVAGADFYQAKNLSDPYALVDAKLLEEIEDGDRQRLIDLDLADYM